MRTFPLVLLFTAMTVLAWGIYGPVLHAGQHGMDSSRLRPFLCVGLSYFVIAVMTPWTLLKTRGEKGEWTASGAFWSLAAGTAGALGALGIILAFTFRGSPVYVMPLVFGGAPVVNTIVTTLVTRTVRQIGPVFLIGIVLVVSGAVLVMLFKPSPHAGHGQQVAVERSGDAVTVRVTEGEGSETYTAPNEAELRELYPEAYSLMRRYEPLKFSEKVLVTLSIGLTVLCWGVYGTLLHTGQAKMGGSRMRPFMCVGLAYFAIAVVIPILVLNSTGEAGRFTMTGTVWSLLGGVCGAVGALGIILAFTFGGKPVYVMPLVFGGAPVVNTFVAIIGGNLFGEIGLVFIAALAMVILGAATVLIFAPRPRKAPGKEPSEAAAEPQKQAV